MSLDLDPAAISITQADAARRLGVSVRTVYNLIAKGKLRARRMSATCVLVEAASLREYWESLEPVA
jgi:excisionase family DNA binding protein